VLTRPLAGIFLYDERGHVNTTFGVRMGLVAQLLFRFFFQWRAQRTPKGNTKRAHYQASPPLPPRHLTSVKQRENGADHTFFLSINPAPFSFVFTDIVTGGEKSSDTNDPILSSHYMCVF